MTTGISANYKQQGHVCNTTGSTPVFLYFFLSAGNTGRHLELREKEVSTLGFCLTQTAASVDNVKKCRQQLNKMTA